MGYCAYESLVGSQVIVFNPDPKFILAIIGTLDGVGDTAIGVRDWRALNIMNLLVSSKTNPGVHVFNKRTGFRRIALASEEIPNLMASREVRLHEAKEDVRRLSVTPAEFVDGV